MKAAIVHSPRDLRIEEADVAPVGPHDVKVRIRAGGICGSDLHYYQHGGFGTVRIQQPMILGHEVAGEVIEVGADVTASCARRPGSGESQPDHAGIAAIAWRAWPNQCLDMRFYGSAMRDAARAGIVSASCSSCTEAQAVPVGRGVPLETGGLRRAALGRACTPSRQAGSLQGKRVLVTGAGPIGALCILVARHAGAREIVATDVVDAPLGDGAADRRRLGASTRGRPEALDALRADKGYFDVVFEASGSGGGAGRALEVRAAARRPSCSSAWAAAMFRCRMNMVVAKEINLRGTFRFHEEFAWRSTFFPRARSMCSRLLTEIVPLADAVRAFELAADRSRAMKVQLAL